MSRYVIAAAVEVVKANRHLTRAVAMAMQAGDDDTSNPFLMRAQERVDQAIDHLAETLTEIGESTEEDS